ncbi:hypothetical protein VYU27_009913 [Nannochloropsis oceanica]
MQEELRSLALKAFESLSTQLVAVHKHKTELERRSEKDTLLYGALSEDKELALEEARKGCESFVKNMQALSEGLDLPLPHLQEDEGEMEGAGGGGLSLWDGDMGAKALGPYDDEDSRLFYEDLPDLLATLPAAMLGLTEEEAAKLRQDKEAKVQQQQQQEEEAALSGVVELAVAEGGLGKPNRRVDQMDVIVEEGGVEGEGEEEEEEEEEGDDNDEDRPRLKEEGEGGEEEGEEEGLTSAHHKINHLLHEVLPLCYHQERSDDFAWQFAPFLRHKRIQKRLLAILFSVPWQNLDLLPQYSRIVATLSPVLPDLGPSLVRELQREFRYFMTKRPNTHLDMKLKTVKYIGELVKFKVCPPIVPLSCTKVCLEAFSRHHVEVACGLLESCGRFLFLTPHTHPHLKHYLDVMMKLKRAKNVDPNLEAFYVIRGQGKSTSTEHNLQVVYKQGDLFVMPHAAGPILHEAEEDLALYWVSDAPLLKYLGVAPNVKTFAPTVYRKDVLEAHVEELRHADGSEHKNRLGILLGNRVTESNTKTLTPTLWSLLNLLPKKTHQPPHRHNSVALDLAVHAAPDGVYTLMGPELDEDGWVKHPIRLDWKRVGREGGRDGWRDGWMDGWRPHISVFLHIQ